MEQDRRQVEAITSRDTDFAQWYTDVCKKAELIDYTSIKGMFVLRPYGYAIWENIQNILDKEFKKTGHTNVSMPLVTTRFSSDAAATTSPPGQTQKE